MKVRIVVIDWEIPARVKKWALRLGIPLGGLATAGGIAYASLPHVFASGETLSAANLNADLQSLDTRLAALEGRRLVQVEANITPESNVCTLSDQKPTTWATAASINGDGTCQLTFVPGSFSGTPICLATNGSTWKSSEPDKVQTQIFGNTKVTVRART
jgi:hypothetical protein